MYHYFYKITNNINGKYYYGVHSTNNLDDGYMGSGKYLHNAYQKYGMSNFTKTILKYFDDSDTMYSYECEIVNIDVVNDKNSYNMAIGGLGHHVGSKHTDEIKQKISETNKGKKLSEKTRQKISIAHKGKHHSEDTKKILSQNTSFKDTKVKEKIRIQKMGKPLSDKHKQSISNGLRGKQKTEEHLKHVSEGLKKSQKLKNSLSSKEYREKMSNSIKGLIFINNGIINKRVNNNEVDIFLNNGWKRGRIKKLNLIANEQEQ